MESIEPFKQTAPNRMEIKEGGGCLSVFGFFFLVPGIFLLLAGAKIIPMGNSEQVPQWGWLMIFMMGLVFAGVGGGLVFGRSWTVIDRSRGKIVKQWGLLVPLKLKEMNLHEYKSVQLQVETAENGDFYPIILRSPADAKELRLYTSSEYGKSYARAAFLSQFLHLPLEDLTTVHKKVLTPDKAGVMFHDQIPDERQQEEPVLSPQDMKSQVSVKEGVMRIFIPGKKLIPWTFLPFPVLLLLFFTKGLPDFQKTHTPEGVQYFSTGFVLFVLGFLPLMTLIKALRMSSRIGTNVTVSPSEILIETCEAGKCRTTRIPNNEIIDLDYGTIRSAIDSVKEIGERYKQNYPSAQQIASGNQVPGWMKFVLKFARSKGVTVKCKQGLFTFGAGLPDPEVRYLHSRVKNHLRPESGNGSSS